MGRKRVLIISAIALLLIVSCGGSVLQEGEKKYVTQPSEEFSAYWYNGEAELTSYRLEQARYGEMHKGHAVLVFVTEPFSIENQVKVDEPSDGDYSILKLNFVKKFTTGIYPYSMMTSSFTPINYPKEHALKITTSSQEWCGHTFNQINNKKGKYKVSSYSYFESEGDQSYELEKAWLEDEFWSKIRLNPSLLPEGEMKVIPSSFYVRLQHKALKPYTATLTKTEHGDSIVAYRVYYEELDRELIIKYKNRFPFTIESWEETYVSGWGDKAQKLTTTATKIKTIKSDYWTKHQVKDSLLRGKLELPN